MNWLTRTLRIGSICYAPDCCFSGVLADHSHVQRLRLYPAFTNRNPDGLFL